MTSVECNGQWETDPRYWCRLERNRMFWITTQNGIALYQEKRNISYIYCYKKSKNNPYPVTKWTQCYFNFSYILNGDLFELTYLFENIFKILIVDLFADYFMCILNRKYCCSEQELGAGRKKIFKNIFFL